MLNQQINEYLDYAWMDLDEVDKIKTSSPLLPKTDMDRPGLQEIRIMRNPEYLGWAAKTLLNIDLLPFQVVVLQELWTKPFPMLIMSRGGSKSFLLAVYATLYCALVPGAKIVIAGAAFRQSKIVFEYMENIWKNAPVLRSVCSNNSRPSRDVDRCTMTINDSWAIAIPIGNGEKVRGLRAHTLISEEFNSISPDIFEIVLSGFTAVSADPVSNVKAAASRKMRKKLDIWSDESEEAYVTNRKNNKVILSGTCGYAFQHFASYHEKYKKIIESRGDVKKLNEIFDDGAPEHFNHKDYSIIRIPYELIPEGFMDDKQIARAKATITTGAYLNEYGAVFSADSDGFFRRSLIESCIANEQNNIQIDGSKVVFHTELRGDPQYKYVIGVDPASEQDNFSIVVLEIRETHNRVVYCWSINRKKFKERLKRQLTNNEYDFYAYCAKKVRQLMKMFPGVVRIGMDAQGGGISVEEALQDPDKIPDGEKPIYQIIDKDKPKETDLLHGLHILEMIQFSRYEWVSEANHGLKKDLEDKCLLFPMFDMVELALAVENDKHNEDIVGLYDSLEDCMMEIEELKDEMATIVISQTGTGVNSRERWDTPEIKLPNGKKGRLRKDRYSALLIANMCSRQIVRSRPAPQYSLIGADLSKVKKVSGRLYYAPDGYIPVAKGINKGR